MDVDAVLLSLQERDKWRRRLDLLQSSLEEIRARRTRLQDRLRSIKRELGRVAHVSDSLLHHTTQVPARGTFNAPQEHNPSRR
ncbi:MAG: hypothetical protein L3K06_02675 [Thermoplasmata archaeon]|nr:hypothetical protein [Thermoplasmata archaeon]MCI4354254.1 hypothetical protein [Thermoplasmata archaeon]